ncbi:MAG: glycogen debranching protein, partial [Armatimonadetes bacterium]|nr:glycogen debranching protein [Armatimonadota bacterium]
MTALNGETLRNLDRALRLEWLETDGLGGYACGTVVGARTRRYHALLMAATKPPVGRRMLVAGLEEHLHVDGSITELGCNLYGDVVHPAGHLLQESFALDPWPVFTWAVGGLRLRKSVCMPHRLGATIIRYDLLQAPGATWVAARPLIAGRGMHHLQQAESGFSPQVVSSPHLLWIQPHDEASRLALHFPGGEFRADGLWYYSFHYPREAERGLDSVEDLYSPGEISWLLRPGETAWLVLGREPLATFDGEALLAAERDRRADLGRAFASDPVAARLALAADQFLVDREVDRHPGRSVIAGYPWFGDWGRDTMIALPGLTLVTGRSDDCALALRTYAANIREGLIPNTFGEGEDPAYNTVDATLWFAVALRRYYDSVRDMDLVVALWPRVCEVLEAYTVGTAFGIHRDEDGLLAAGDATTQLTWMDAKVGDWLVTPRHGKAVEINALWYNALRIGEFFADRLGDDALRLHWGRLARQARRGFEQFWSDELGYCYDCLRPEGPDAALRPNQLLALSLPYTALSAERGRRMLDVVTERLLTPYGLRTLAPGSPGYAPHYGGDQWARDGAYHQGTVWPWLMGPYVSALFRVYGASESLRDRARDLLRPL